MTEASGSDLAERLERSRAAMLEALAERTEADFGRALGGAFGDETLGHALATLAQAERAELAAARSEPRKERTLPDQPLPPQVTHALAGARHRTLSHLEALDRAAAEALVAGIEAREAALVARIGAILETPAEASTTGTGPRLEFPMID